MGLPNAAFVLYRHLWLQSLQRHYLATGLEVLIVVALSYVAVPKSAPTKAPLISDVAVAEPIIGPAKLAYPEKVAHDKRRTRNVVYGPQNAATDALVKAAFGGKSPALVPPSAFIFDSPFV
ncbi:hypothetical protein V5799_010554 [Amblyomma americanum]|uniref:Uncharacterized protein n=1 Tax=Amblyomma americanum TaxID=6943 RepID=A0AAQ4EKE2_AMBAM